MRRSLLLALAAALGLAACTSDDEGDTGSGAGGSGPVFGTGPGVTAGPGSTGTMSGASAGTTSGSSTGSATGATATTSTGAGGGSCTPVTLGELLDTDVDEGGSSLAYALEGLEPTQTHVLYLEFFDVDGAQTAGTFDLSSSPDDNYQTCARCLLAFEDFDADAPTAYYPSAGAMVVTTPDTAYVGASAGTLQDVVLAEVDLRGGVTTEVPGGACLHIDGEAWDTSAE